MKALDAAQAPEKSFLDTAIPTALRIGGAVGGGIAGTIAAPGPGTLAGGAAGGALGELLAQKYEGSPLNLTQIGVQGALGALPVGRAAGTLGRIALKRAGVGAAQGAVGAAATESAETRKLPSLGTIGTGALWGTALGGGLGALEGRALRRLGKLTPVEATPPVTPMVAPPVARQTTRPVPAPPLADSPVVTPSGQSGSTKIPDPMAGFDPLIQKFNQSPEIQSGVDKVLRDNQGFADQRRNIIRASDLDEFASVIEIDSSRVLPKGTALNAEQITAYGRAFLRTTQKVNELAKVVSSGRAVDGNILALQGARAEQEVIAASLTGSRAEAGRALSAFNFWNGVLDTADQKLIEKVANGPGARREAQRIAKALAELPTDASPLTRYRLLKKMKRSTIMDKARSYYYANILSGVKTHERNIVGNIANIASNLAVHPMAAGIDAAASAVRGTPRTIRLEGMSGQAAGALAGLSRGGTDFVFTLRNGVSPDALSRSLHTGELGKLDIPRVEFAGGGKNPFNIPGRLLDASDTFFRSIAKNMEQYGMAHTAAKNKGLTGKAFLDEVALLRSATTPEGIDIRDAAQLFARRTVFQEEPGPVIRNIQALSRVFPPFAFVVPFIRTPANILRQGIEFSPLGVAMPAAGIQPWRVASRKTGRAARQAQARVAVGTAAAGLLAYLAAAGRLSGKGPSNAAERNALYQKGWKPNSVKIFDGTWVSYQLFQPVSVQAAIIANYFEEASEFGDEDSYATAAANIMTSSLNSFLDQSFLSGLFDFVEAIQSPDSSAARTIGRTASGLLPLSALSRTVAQGIDPVIRKPRTVEQNIMTSIPGLSKMVPPRVTSFGEEVLRPGGALKRMIDPFNWSTEIDDPVANELKRLGLNISVPSPRLTMPVQLQARSGLDEFPLSDTQSTALRKAQGRAVRNALERVMQSSRYRNLSDVGRESLIRSMRTRAVKAVRDQARRELLLNMQAP
jgi:hypothetical protein